MFLPSNDNPQYNRLMGALRYRLGSSSIATGIALWLIVIIAVSTYLLSLLILNEREYVFLYCCCGSGTLTVFSVVFGINSVRYTARDCTHPHNDLIMLSMLSNASIVNGYWRSIFGQLLARHLFPFVALPFIYGFLNLGALLILSFDEPAGFEVVWTAAMLTLGQMGFYWFLIMLGIMLALTIRRTFWAMGVFIVMSIILLSIWVIANLTLIGRGSDSMSPRFILFFSITLAIINAIPYLGLFLAWRIAIFSARYALWPTWRNYQDKYRAKRGQKKLKPKLG